ncbi:MAG: protein kinase [Polyangiaceae bacterium]
MSEGLTTGSLIAGKFRILSKLGEGGMGAVYVGEHVDLHQKVAIKVILAAELGDEMLKRFRREALVLAQLESEHAVRVIDYGTLTDGSPYLVMEFLKGMDLDKYVRTHGPVSVEEAAEIGVSVCDALADAHAKGIIHRDLKPSNLFLVDRPNGRRVVKVLDFGLSLRRRSGEETITHTHAVLGTPLYAAPEQFNASKDADGRADIWSLGASLYELVTGRVPFPASTLAELAKMLREGAPPASTLNAKVPEAFSDVLLRCLKRRLEERYLDVVELKKALKPFRALGKSSALFGEAFSAEDRAAFAVTDEASAAPEGAVTPTEVDRKAAALAQTEVPLRAGVVAGNEKKKSTLVPIAIAFAVVALLGAGALGVLRLSNREKPAPLPMTSATVADPGAPQAPTLSSGLSRQGASTASPPPAPSVSMVASASPSASASTQAGVKSAGGLPSIRAANSAKAAPPTPTTKASAPPALPDER